MQKIKIFKNPEFGEVRTVCVDGEYWFVGKDIAQALGYEKPRNAIQSHVDNEDKKGAPIQGTLGGIQQMTIINESGLYSLILSSKLDNAKKFKRWVTSEVLPSLRRTGGYSIQPGGERSEIAEIQKEMKEQRKMLNRLMSEMNPPAKIGTYRADHSENEAYRSEIIKVVGQSNDKEYLMGVYSFAITYLNRSKVAPNLPGW